MLARFAALAVGRHPWLAWQRWYSVGRTKLAG